VRIDVTDWNEEEDFVKAKWRFSSILRVPWRPVLAAGGSTTHKFDPDTGLVRWGNGAQRGAQPLRHAAAVIWQCYSKTPRKARIGFVESGPLQRRLSPIFFWAQQPPSDALAARFKHCQTLLCRWSSTSRRGTRSHCR